MKLSTVGSHRSHGGGGFGCQEIVTVMGSRARMRESKVDGSGSATVAASERLDVNINGSGSVEYSSAIRW